MSDSRKVNSPLILVPKTLLKEAVDQRTNSEDPIERFLSIANFLDAQDNPVANTRGEFIKRQIAGEDCEPFFEAHKENWGIPKFCENLITVNEFKNGFLWVMKDYTTAFSENGNIREWHILSPETFFIRKYEAWDATKNGKGDEMFHHEYGDCKQLFKKFSEEYGLLEFNQSPVFDF